MRTVMKKLLQILTLSALTTAVSANVVTPNVVQPADVEQPQLQESPTPGIQDAYEHVVGMSNSYKHKLEKALAKAGKKHIVTVGLSIQEVNDTTASQNWGASRAVAYTKAMSEVRAGYVSSINVSIQTETLNKLFNTDDAPEITKADLNKAGNAFEEMLDKAVALANGKLDVALNELGVDPAQYNAAPVEKRKLMMRNFIATKTKVTAYGDLSGMTVKRTFEATDVHGNTVVAVLTLVSPKMRDRVQSLLDSRGNIAADPAKIAKGIDINSWVVENEDKLIFEQGIKLMYDTNGMPMLVSFGQFPIKGYGTKKQLRSKAKFAKPHASNNAFANFAELYNMNGQYKNATKSGVVTSQFETVKSNADGSIERDQKTLEKTINEINQTMKTAANLNNAAGIKTIHTWMMMHPSNLQQMILGEVKVWSPESDKAARQIRAGKVPTNTAQVLSATKAAEENSGAYESTLELDMDDF